MVLACLLPTKLQMTLQTRATENRTVFSRTIGISGRETPIERFQTNASGTAGTDLTTQRRPAASRFGSVDVAEAVQSRLALVHLAEGERIDSWIGTFPVMSHRQRTWDERYGGVGGLPGSYQ